MRRVLIISPHFPPQNSAEVHRVRTSLPYFERMGWQAEVVAVHPRFSELRTDPLLAESIPGNTKLHYVGAFSKKWTSRLGLGSIALRSLWHYRRYVDQLLQAQSFDLVYFSTTQFPVMVLGPHWKKKFGIPYVLDMQDPWHSDFYKDKPRRERPRKYWFSYRLNKALEPIAMRSAGGLISVSQAYLDTLKERYPMLADQPQSVIPFGAFPVDFDIAEANAANISTPAFTKGHLHLVYVGRGGYDIQPALRKLFGAFRACMDAEPALFSRIRFHFIGTSYAPAGRQAETVLPVARELGLQDYVAEQTARIGFFEAIRTLQLADGLVIAGSTDPAYSPSKLYPYILARRPLFAIFNGMRSAGVIHDCHAGIVTDLHATDAEALERFKDFVTQVSKRERPQTDWERFETYSAAAMTARQVDLFNTVTGRP